MNDRELQTPGRFPRPGSALTGDKLPPHDTAAEEAILGAILLSPSENLPEVQKRFVGEQPFFNLQLAAIYSAMLDVFDNGQEALDVITLQAKLKDRNELEQVGGFGYLATLTDKAGMAGNLGSYLDIVWEKFLARKLVQISSETVGHVFQTNGVNERLLGQLTRTQEEFIKLSQRGDISPKYLKTAADFQEGFFAQFFGGGTEAPGATLPIPFPLKIRRRETTLVSGDDGSGKSTLLNYFALHLGNQDEKIGIASMEMPPEVTIWILASQLLGTKHLPDTDEGRRRAAHAISWINQHFLFYNFTGIADWRDLLDTWRYAAEHHGMTAAIIDSVMRVGIADDDYAQQGFAAAQFAQFAKDHNVHLFFVIHENKGDGSGKQKVRGSKLWTANADNVLQVKLNHDKGQKAGKLEWELDVAKKREKKDHDEIADLEKQIAYMKRDWDTELVLRKQRWPGSQQNASKRFWFDRESFQFRAHWEDPATNWLDCWRRATERKHAKEERP